GRGPAPVVGKPGLVLPELTFVEKSGSYTNGAGTMQAVRRAVEPPSGARSLARVLMTLAERLGKPMAYPAPQRVQQELHHLRALAGSAKRE
ncbi:MAG: hypothetical protein PVTTEEND_002048, partial [Candidatus Fervidibacter sp.]